jgi:hypothetical protein
LLSVVLCEELGIVIERGEKGNQEGEKYGKNCWEGEDDEGGKLRPGGRKHRG